MEDQRKKKGKKEKIVNVRGNKETMEGKKEGTMQCEGNEGG